MPAPGPDAVPPALRGALRDAAHDLRAQVTIILGFSELLRDGKVGPVSEDQQACLEDVLAGARAAAKVADRLSAMAGEPARPDPPPTGAP